MRVLLSALYLVLAVSPHLFAAPILYENFTPPPRGFGALLTSGEYTQAEDVLLRRRSHITGLSFLGGQRPDSQISEFAWLIFAENDASPGYPGAELARGMSPVTMEPFRFGGVATNLVSLTLDVTLEPGRYWFGLHGGSLDLAPGECADESWGWLTAKPNGTYTGREAQWIGMCDEGGSHWMFDDGAWWTSHEHTLQIRGVPEPASATLLTLGILAWAGRRLRR